ncbi:MAG: FTR1 family protein [Anaerolineae bacterium]|nr:FTR1 family protein [Candidatus Roseilinea sp.]MDW8449339.1 FTR1 family protein [Anaerolineae bacterium]
MRLESVTRALARVARASAACSFAVALALPIANAHAAEPRPPADVAEDIRSALVAAQIEPDREAAVAQIQEARAAYMRELAPAVTAHAPSSHALIARRFDDAIAALRSGRMADYAQACASAWTALLGAGYRIVVDAASEGDAELARQWLPLREFRRSTRFARPGAEATLALEDLARGKIAPEAAVQAVNADLLDTYQARMIAALNDVASAHARGFLARQAELAALAAGYFDILAPAYREQRGEAALADAQAAFEALNRVALEGREVAPAVQRIQAALRGFRAAPLSPAEQTRRAGQMMRYLKLVPIEYGRGIRNGEVAVDLEIREAATFHEGALAAFNDLRDALEARDATRTAQAGALLERIGQAVASASMHRVTASPDALRADSDRLIALLGEVMPPEWLKQDAAADFDVVATALDQMEQAAKQGEYALAESARVEAYAVLESGPEARIAAFAPHLKTPIEGLFWFGYEGGEGLASLLQRKAPPAEVRAARRQLDAQLKQAQEALRGSNSPAAIALNSGIIVLREGLEAVLILAALMASFRTAANRHLRRPMWLGTALAVVASIATWLILRSALSLFASFGEKLEAIVSLIAIGVLLLITNWFFHDVYWTGWMANFHKQKQQIVKGSTGQFAGLLLLGFASVYREGFETALFLQALTLEGGPAVVLAGGGVGLLCVALIGLAIFALQMRLPVMKMLIATGVMIGFVLLVMVGNTAHIMQVVGWLPLTPIRWLPLPYWFGIWFGTYATVEGLALQVAAAVFVIGSFFLAKHLQMRRAFAPARATSAS